MKAVILAAGRGTRMKELTKDSPKPVLEVNGYPFLGHIIDSLIKAGATDIGVVVGYQKKKVIDFLNKNYPKAIPLFQEEITGTATAVNTAKGFVSGENFLLVNGDDLHAVEDYKKFLVDDDYNYIGGFKSESPERYGQLVNHDGFLSYIAEKHVPAKTNIVNAGIYKFTPGIFDAITKIDVSPRGEFEITDAISLLAFKGLVKVAPIEKYWVGITNPEDIEKAGKFLNEQK